LQFTGCEGIRLLGDGGRLDGVDEFVDGLNEGVGELEAFASTLVVERTRF
jgi:hypothetical protein